MDSRKFMIITKGDICTKRVKSYKRDANAGKIDITFDNGSCYSYLMGNVIFMSDPKVLQPNNYLIEAPDGKRLYGVKEIYQFEHVGEKYWHIVFDTFELDYKKSDLRIIENCLSNKKSSNTFEYLREIASLNELSAEDGGSLLMNYYNKIGFIPEDSALSLYLDPSQKKSTHLVPDSIFPFGCNQSQYLAVHRALNNRISVIQGPPGTGKTQTILNIIANLLINKKTVLVVSNNNSATQNVLEKLSKDKYRMSFLVAPLGSADNKNSFIESQMGKYPDLSTWRVEDTSTVSLKEISTIAEKLQRRYQLQEEIARLKEKQYEIELEAKHFDEYADETAAYYQTIRIRKKLTSDKVMKLWQEVQYRADHSKSLTIRYKLRSVLIYGIADWAFYKQDLAKIITVLQGMYYKQILKEVSEQLCAAEKELEDLGDYSKDLEEKSLAFLKDYVSRNIEWKKNRPIHQNDDFYRAPKEVLNDYPIILSTTFSARSSLNMDNLEYDYVIMDEASQVDIATGALALSCAKNAVIVGDLKQLPNVVTPEVRAKANQIREHFDLNAAYDFANNSFLQSIVDLMPDVPSTLLKEHYRCNPRIISFCNQKFYNGELVVMTEDDDTSSALMAVKTVEGNHARGHYNQREIDVIKGEILPGIESSSNEIGIIAPYNEQVEMIHDQIPGIDVATVHKFQGREKDVIILSTVDNQIKNFTDDPYLLNVAVSRAKKRLIIVTSGNKQARQGNIADLIAYIQYNKMEVTNSQIYSVFDYLYSQYREYRWKYLKGKRRISEYDSENLTYNMLLDILKDHPDYGVQCFEPLSMVVRDLSKLSDEEIRYALNPATHLDFIIYNKVSKEPIAAIETDGYIYHKAGTAQHERDLKKDHILETVGLKMIRLSTNGSNEKEKVIKVLDDI